MVARKSNSNKSRKGGSAQNRTSRVKNAAEKRASRVDELKNRNLAETNPWLGSKLLGLLDWSVPQEEMVTNGAEGVELVLPVNEKALYVFSSSQNRHPQNVLVSLSHVVRQCCDRNGLEVMTPKKGM